MIVPDYVLIQGDVDCGVAIADRNTGTVYANESTSPALTVNGQGTYINGCRGSIVREGFSSNFWAFVQDFSGDAPLLLTRVMITPPVGTASSPSFNTENVTLAGIGTFSGGSGRWVGDGSIIFAAGLSVYKFWPGTGVATALFTAPGGDATWSGEDLQLSNVSNQKVLAFTPNHIYQLNIVTLALQASWAMADFGFGANSNSSAQLAYDGVNTAWVIAATSGPNSDVYQLNLSAKTKTQLTTGTDYISHTLVLNTVANCLGMVRATTNTLTTVALVGGAVATTTLPASSTGALAVDEAGYFWTADNAPVDIATASWKIDPFSLSVALTVGYDHFASVPADAVPRGQCYGFVTPGIVIGHAANLNAYDNGGPISPSFPPGNGELIEDLTALNNWCRANGISISLKQDSQRTAKDLLDELFTVGNSAPVYSGDKLKIIPYDEVSWAGNGAVYIASTAAGPIADLTDKDFVKGKTPAYMRKRRASCDNVVAIEHIDRNLDYGHNVTTEPDQMHVALYGPRKGGTLDAAQLGMNNPSGTKALLSIYSADVAQAIASILAKRGATGLPDIQFSLKAEWFCLEAMALVTITDARLGFVKTPVRLKSAKENSNREIECVAERFLYGLNHPDRKATTAATGTLVAANVDPGLVNTPIIFQPPIGMLPTGSGPQVWFVVSGADPNFGGSIPNASVDGGISYPEVLGSCGPATTGVLTASFASGSDPDTVNALAVDLTESNGKLSPESQQIADGFADPCFVESASGFEVVCPTAATLGTPAHHYSMGTYIRRGVGGTTIASHASGKRFAVLDAAVLKIDLPAVWVGKTIHLKFRAFNPVGGQLNDLSVCVDYTFTPVSTFLPGGFYVNGS